jgi:hypothetical protein
MAVGMPSHRRFKAFPSLDHAEGGMFTVILGFAELTRSNSVRGSVDNDSDPDNSTWYHNFAVGDL